MTKHSTQIDTINFVYNEMSADKSQQYLRHLSNDEELFSLFSEMVGLMSNMDDALIQPSQTSIDNILRYAENPKKVTS